ncbi:MAG: cbb3-type cytochrome oxidase assembly protein CcoS [Ignavibacterium sp.]|nr:cbb3-type cytochrome oxidase assembly protein CcoS [Ignavibacterium sp.]MDW8374546.1 cbb3-type cytochrome oxidase assembly protein CcoS [Ignavibacteriales bacterium]
MIAFIWSVKSGQFQDTFTPSIRILFDEVKKENEDINKENNSNKNKE